MMTGVLFGVDTRNLVVVLLLILGVGTCFGVDTQKLDEYAGEQVIVLGINGACCLCPKSEQRRLLDALEVREDLD